ncbi:hypothetical protein DB30_06742 [Enhygromyxa salina]|uniref:FtsH ternary system domain-containing protein n=1 Tax=Enhygromyxa salina TaxID=215803 RepID=A0A0C2CXY6_9BACT|nr:hypothetical protein [Enhygromyxa salina]KIG14515.1 hypothetical protein DB30_06742 [Enhygromyxa salina]
MSTLVIEDHDALRVALDSGLIPAAVQAAPVSFELDEDQRLLLEPSVEIGRSERKKLREVGVAFSRRRIRAGQTLRCWAELIDPEPAPEPQLPLGEVLFVSEGDHGFLRLSGELLRLGSEDQRLAFFDDEHGQRRNLCRVADPPYYALLRALDRDDPLRAYLPARPGGRVWVEIGARHPQAARLDLEPGELVLIPRGPAGARAATPAPTPGCVPWLRAPDGPWLDLQAVSDVTLPSLTSWRGTTPKQRLAVELRLVRAPSKRPADLWVLRERALEQIEQLVCTVPDEVVARLRFAIVEQPTPHGDGTHTCVVLRARRSAKGPPALDLNAEAYVPAAQIPDLYLPVGAMIDPPLRPSRLRELLGDDAPGSSLDQRVVWLAPQGSEGRRGHSFSRESLDETAFAPLSEWVDYLVGAHEHALAPWVRSTAFDLDSFVSIGVEWEDGEAPKPKREPKPKRDRLRREPEFDEHDFATPVSVEIADAGPGPQVDPEQELRPIDLPRSEIEAQLSALETAFCELDTPLDDPGRTAAWADLGNLQAALHRSREAGLCWSRALWPSASASASAGGPSPLVLAHRWVASECAMLGYPDGGHMLGIVDIIDVDLDEQMVRALAAEVVYAELYTRASPAERDRAAASLGSLAQVPPPLGPELLARLQRFFATHGARLDLRTLWLARSALARLAGDDRLALFQTRDLIMGSLREGVGLARNIPNFVRTHGTDGDASDLGRLADELQRVRDEYLTTKRKRSTIESTYPEARTDAYVRLVLAWGLARLGRPQVARQELEAGEALLGDSIDPARGDPIHIAAHASYAARIQHALEGLPPGAPLSAEPNGPIAARERLSNIDRFKYDRLLQLSRVLDPREDTDAFDKWNRKDDEPFAGLALLTHPEDLAALFDRMLAGMTTQGPERVARALGELLEFLEALPEPLAVPRLHAALPFVSAAPLELRPKLLRNALLLAGYYDRPALIDDALATLAVSDAELTEQRPAEYAELLTRCAAVLRRSNNEAQLSSRLTKLEERVGDNSDLPGVVAQLHIAAGFAALGQPGRVQGAFTAAYTLLPELAAPPPKLQVLQTLLREIAVALSRSTPGQAIAGARALMQRLPSTSDSLSTTSHFCLSVIQLMEAVVLSLASEDLALSQWARRWVEDDEHLLHRRIHTDLSSR